MATQARRGAQAANESPPPPAADTSAAAAAGGGGASKSVTDAQLFAAPPAPAPTTMPTHEAAKLNQLHDLAVDINAQDLVVQRRKDDLTKARKDREALVQKHLALSLELTLPLETAVLKRMDAPLFDKSGIPNADALADPAAVVERAKGKRGAKADATGPLDDAQREAAGVALPPPPPQGFIPLSATGMGAGALQLAADSWVGGKVSVIAYGAGDGGEVQHYAALDATSPDWPGRDWGAGVFCLLPVMKEADWRQTGATLPKDEARNGPLIGKKIKDEDGKPWFVGPLFAAAFVVTPDADKRLLAGTAPASHGFLDARAVGILYEDLVAAAETAEGLEKAAGDQRPKLQLVRDGNARAFAVLTRYKPDNAAQEHFDIVAAIPADEWQGKTRSAADARQAGTDEWAGVQVMNLDDVPYVLGPDHFTALASPPATKPAKKPAKQDVATAAGKSRAAGKRK